MKTMIILGSKSEDADMGIPFSQFVVLDQVADCELVALILA